MGEVVGCGPVRVGAWRWCCFLANPQNGDIAELLEGSVFESPFGLALGSARWMVIVPNRTVREGGPAGRSAVLSGLRGEAAWGGCGFVS